MDSLLDHMEDRQATTTAGISALSAAKILFCFGRVLERDEEGSVVFPFHEFDVQRLRERS